MAPMEVDYKCEHCHDGEAEYYMLSLDDYKRMEGGVDPEELDPTLPTNCWDCIGGDRTYTIQEAYQLLNAHMMYGREVEDLELYDNDVEYRDLMIFDCAPNYWILYQ
jgi:hypothetical protein